MRFFSVLAIAFALAFVVSSCKKEVKEELAEEAVQNELQSNGPTQVNYYMDGNSVPTLDLQDSRIEILTVFGTEQKPEENVINYYGFSAKDDMMAFADAQNIPIRDAIQGGEYLADLAETNQVDIEYERTGNVPQWYLDEVNNRFPNRKTQSVAVMWDNCWSGGPSIIDVTPGLPVMYPGWNNRVSRYDLLNIYGVMIIYDRTFYRSRILTAWNWGWQWIHICAWYPWADNRMSSCLHP
jgi:hypothetical protein